MDAEFTPCAKSLPIVIRIEGGLRNQLFQYATGCALAERLGCGIALDLRDLKCNFALKHYQIRAVIAEPELLELLPNWRPSRRRRITFRLFSRFFTYPVFWSRSFAYDKRFEQIARPVYLVGYWQTEKYFARHRTRLLEELQLVTPLPTKTPLFEMIYKTNSVALHIRRGDYVTNPIVARFHGQCDISYYQNAVQKLHNRYSDIEVFVFSDEPDWARNNLRLHVPTHYIAGNPDYIDFELMRACQHHIIANSSFSWWGAWLCVSNNQIVYAPRQWFLDPKTDISDIIPNRWISL